MKQFIQIANRAYIATTETGEAVTLRRVNSHKWEATHAGKTVATARTRRAAMHAAEVALLDDARSASTLDAIDAAAMVEYHAAAAKEQAQEQAKELAKPRRVTRRRETVQEIAAAAAAAVLMLIANYASTAADIISRASQAGHATAKAAYTVAAALLIAVIYCNIINPPPRIIEIGRNGASVYVSYEQDGHRYDRVYIEDAPTRVKAIVADCY